MKRFAALLTLALVIARPAAAEDLLPAPNLVVDGIPPIPAAIVESARRYAEFRTAVFRGWHPVEIKMLIATRAQTSPQIFLVDALGAPRRQMTVRPGPGRMAGFQPRHGKSFVFSKDVGGGEWYQNYRHHIATGGITLLTDGRSRNTRGVWSNKGDRMVYGSTRRNGKDVDFYVIDPLDPASNALLAELDKGAAWDALDWSPDDSTILALETVSINESHLWVFDARTGAKERLTPAREGEPVSYRRGVYSKDGKRIYVITDRDSEHLRLAAIDLATKEHRYLTAHIPWDVTEFDLSQDGTSIAFVTNEDGVGVLRVLDLATGAEQGFKLPRGLVGGVAWHRDGRRIGFTMSSATMPGDAFAVDLASRVFERWTTSASPGTDPKTFREPELIRWTSFDGRPISGLLYRPPPSFTGKRPVVVGIHGGPEGQARPSFMGRANYYLNELGVAIVLPNIRGSTGYGKTFTKLDNGTLREDSYRDVEVLLDWIKREPGLDGDRILVTGVSYGGHVTFAVAANYSDKIRCALPVVGMSNLVSFLERTEAYRRDLRRVEYGDERDPEMRAFLERIAPLNKAERIKKPIFIVQGLNDPRVPASEAEQMVKRLKQIGTPVWFLLAKDEGHGFAKKPNIDYQFYATILFMQRCLLD